MSTAGVSGTPLRKAIRHELQAIRGKWIWLVALGIALIVLGTILLGSPVIATLATVTALGVLILDRRRNGGRRRVLVSGVERVLPRPALGHPGRRGRTDAAGQPDPGGITLTILLASFLFVGGIFKAVAAIAHRFEGWGWLLLSGAIDVVLGVMIWRELPMSGLTIIGVLVGISIIFRGVSWLMVGFALKRLPQTAA